MRGKKTSHACIIEVIRGTFPCFLLNTKDYWSLTRIPNRDKKIELLYLVHPLTYRQVYLTKDAYFVEKIHGELVEMT